MTTIRGTKEIAKYNRKFKEEGNYEQFPADIMNYVQLELITHTDIYLYMTLIRYHNKEYGYAYPSNNQLEVEMGIAGGTLVRSKERLVKAGLIDIVKSANFANKDTYYTYFPLTQEELYQQAPKEAAEYQQRKELATDKAARDKVRYTKHLQEKKETERTVNEVTQEVTEKVIETRESREVYEFLPEGYVLSPEDEEMLEKLDKLG
ncbi:helix-turn-helix domain-containing protein [Bacillus cereus]|uniref:helix-turn-helix domain-containing protein n=1 Tax=Bacillus cereus TaxID=1396 RepID=UPI0018F42A31|nr:helix-turn-helix domain-containing protein [Bacillus cereus]MBJ7987188.1 helix-turn-helix domain-containing protein [Bacillus cereus]